MSKMMRNRSEVKVNSLKSARKTKEKPDLVDTQENVTRVFSRKEKLELEMKIRRMKELEANHKEYEKIYEELKKRFKRVNNLKIGEFLVTGEEYSRKEFVTPAGKFWKMKIIKL